MMNVPESLIAAAETFRERNTVYRDSYRRHGALLLALFGEQGIPAITTTADANRLHLLNSCVMKLDRYAQNFAQGGHADSALDLIVYAAMLHEATEGGK